MFGDALSTPVKASDAAVTTFIGGVLVLLSLALPVAAGVALVSTPLALLLLPVAVLPVLILRGYYVAVIAAGARRDAGAPSIVRWGTLLSDGVKSVVVSVGYLLPAVLVAALGVGALVALVPPEVADPAVTDPASAPTGVDTMSDTRALAVLAVFGLGSLFLLGYALLYTYLRPAALAVFAVSGSLREAFRLGRVRQVAGSGDYAVGWLLAVLVLAVGGLLTLPLVVLLVGFVLVFYLQVVAHSLYGRGATGVLVPEAVGDGAPTAVETDDENGKPTDDDGDETQTVGADDGVTPAGGPNATTEDDDPLGDLPSEWTVDDAGPHETETPDDADTDALTDWDDVSAAVESADPQVTRAGGVSAAVQTGSGVPVDDAEDDLDSDDAETDPEAATTDDDSFQWGTRER